MRSDADTAVPRHAFGLSTNFRLHRRPFSLGESILCVRFHPVGVLKLIGIRFLALLLPPADTVVTGQREANVFITEKNNNKAQ